MADTIRTGRICMSPEMLLDMLDLGAGHRLIAVIERRDVWSPLLNIEVIVAGPSMPEHQAGELAPDVEVQYRRKDYDIASVTRREPTVPQ